MFKLIVREWYIFIAALQFFTRVPIPFEYPFQEEYLQKSSRYFAAVGILVGAFSSLVLYLALFLFPLSISLMLSMLATVYLTAGFHEDGLADVCDGFGGGWNRADILRIMKDSRVGTYGSLAIVFAFALKFASLYELAPDQIMIAMIIGHTSSRFFASTLIFTLPYARDETSGKSKPSSERMSLHSLLIAAFFVALPLWLLPDPIYLLALLAPLGLRFYLSQKFNRWIQGHTGDCAGATQQICEIAFYLGLLAVNSYVQANPG